MGHSATYLSVKTKSLILKSQWIRIIAQPFAAFLVKESNSFYLLIELLLVFYWGEQKTRFDILCNYVTAENIVRNATYFIVITVV